jgi:methylene-fatty-acyl-phospholipid synthase
MARRKRVTTPLDLGVFLVAAALLAVERIAYAWIWRQPARFAELAGRMRVADPVNLLEQLFVGFKVLQLVVFGGWCWYFGDRYGWPDTYLTPLGAALLVTGQLLNASVFIRLGRIGVFYGERFGRAVPWCNDFPFSIVSHPQYTGAVLSIWGLFLLVRFPADDWIVLPLLETFYYALGAIAEAQPAIGHNRGNEELAVAPCTAAIPVAPVETVTDFPPDPGRRNAT